MPAAKARDFSPFIAALRWTDARRPLRFTAVRLSSYPKASILKDSRVTHLPLGNGLPERPAVIGKDVPLGAIRIESEAANRRCARHFGAIGHQNGLNVCWMERAAAGNSCWRETCESRLIN